MRILPWAAGQTPTMAARQGRLSRRARADHAQPLAGLELEGDALDDEPRCVPGGAHAHRLRGVSDAAGFGSSMRAWSAGSMAEQAIEAPPALARRGEAAPVGDRDLDRRQGARRQDRARDDDAGRWPAD